ncbi:putative ribonuclease H-like domain-containing protein, partial [Tanacetum coccineum]
AETFDWDEEEVSDEEEVTQVKVLMDLADDELTVGKSHARNDWVKRFNPDSKLPNFNTGRILVPESQAVNESLEPTKTLNTPKSSKDSEAESITPLPPMKNLQGALPSSEILKAKAKPFPPCTHYGLNDHRPSDCRNYPNCEIYGSYDHSTSGHNRVIQIRGGVLAESSQSNESSVGRHIKEPIWYLDSGCSRSKIGVKSYMHKYVEQLGPKVVFRDNSSCITEGYGSINCGDVPVESDDEASNHEDASDTGAAPKQQQQIILNNCLSQNIKLPILKKEILSPVTVAEIPALKRKEAKKICCMAIPKEHMRKIHGMDDAKEICKPSELCLVVMQIHGIEKMYEGCFQRNIFEAFKISNSKWLERDMTEFNITFSLEAHGAEVSTDDAKHIEIKGASKTNFKCSKFAFVLTKQKKEFLHGFADEVIYSFFAKQSEDWDLLQKIRNKIDDVDIEEYGHKWQIAMIAIRMNNSIRKQEGISLNVTATGDTRWKEEERPPLYQHQEAGKQEKNHMGLLTMDDGVPHPLSGDYTPKPQEEIDDSLYVKKMAREAEVKKVVNTGNLMEKPVWTKANRVQDIKFFRPKVNAVSSNVNTIRSRQPGNWGSAVKTSAGYNWRNSKPNSNCDSGPTFIRTDHPLKNMVDRGIFDSGCSGHMTGNKDQLEDFEEFNGGSVTFGGSKGYISGKGKIRVGNLDFDSVSFVKELGHFNLFSISQICDKQHKVLFTETECLVVSSDFKMPDENQILLKVPRHHNMYSFDMKTPTPAKGFACLIAKATSDESKLWHRRLGHINFKNLNKLVKGNLVRGLPSKVFKNDHTCVACHKGKQHRASCKAKLERLITEPLHTLHMDLFGPTSVKSINHASYCLVITDDCTRFSWVFFLASKDETSGILQNFIRQIENQLSHRVKIIRSDNGTEFKNRDMLEFCGNKGIKQEYSNARTPQQNGVAERMNRTLIEAARTMLADSLLPTTFWAEAVSTACYIFNRVRVTKPQNKTPYELLFGHKPIISYIRPFGCHVTILDTLSVLGKFDGKSDEGFLVGYSLNSKAYRVYNLVTKRVEVNLHVNFLEDKPNVKGVGYRWMFDIDYLTDSMNYIPVSLENQANPHAGASEVTNSAGTPQTLSSNASKEKDEDVELIVVPSTVRNTEEKAESRKSSTNSKKEEILTELQQEKKASSTDTSEDNPKIIAFRRELEEIALKHLGTVSENNSTSTPSVNTGNESVNTGRLDPDDSPMPELEIFHKSETGIFDEASYDEEGVITDFNSLPTEIEVSPTPTLRIHNIHPKSQILGDPKSAVQTRSKVQQKSGAHALFSFIQKQQRNNHKDQQHCLFACFLSQEEPKKIAEALQDDSWVQAMQEELLQFKLQQVYKGGQSFIMDCIKLLEAWSSKSNRTREEYLHLSGQVVAEGDTPESFDLVNVKAANNTHGETQGPLTKDEEALDVDEHLYSIHDSTLMYYCL